MSQPEWSEAISQLSQLVVVAFLHIWGFWWIVQFFNSQPTLFFLKSGNSSHTPVLLLRPRSVHSGSVSWVDCGQVFPDMSHVSSPFPDRFSHFALTAQSAHSDFNGPMVYIYMRVGVTCHLLFLQNDTCHLIFFFCRMSRVFYVPLRKHRVEMDTEWEWAQKV